MSEQVNGRIGEKQPAPLLVIADESDEPAAPALIAVEEPAAEAPLPAPAVEAIVTQAETRAPAPKPAAQTSAAAPAPAPVAPAPAVAAAPHAPQPIETAPAASAPLPQPAAPADVAEPAMAAKPRHIIRRYIPLAAVSMAVFASSLSVIGLLVASRTLAETKIVLEQVQAHQSKMRHLDTLIDEVDALRQREQIAMIRIEQINAGKPATSAEVRSAIASLQLAMAKYQPDNLNNTLTNIRDGQYELAERVSTVYRRVERIDEQMAKMAPSSSPKAKRAGDREPIS
jgi:hypothetical protein